MGDKWRDEQEFYQSLVERRLVSGDEASLLRRVVPLELVRRLLGGNEPAATASPANPPSSIPIMSPDGTVWRITVNDQGKARTEKG